MTVENQTWMLRRRPDGAIRKGDFELVTEVMPPLAEGMVRVKTLYISVDPTNRIWMSDIDGYFPPIPIDSPLVGGSVGEVIESNADGYTVGQLVSPGLAPWARYNDCAPEAVNPLPEIPGVPVPAFLGPLGATGLTAYFGLTDIGQPKAGDTLVVSAAAGAVGSIVGQIGKIMGCRVVGIAGSDAKCKWLTEVAGFDAAINYKTEDLDAALTQHCPDGVDINFESVGGIIMDTVIGHLNDFSRMPLCGLISSYNAKEPVPGPYNFTNLLMRRTRMQGFIIVDYMDQFPQGFAQLAEWILSGQIKYELDEVKAIENIPVALDRLFEGKNTGKVVVKIAGE